MNDRLMVSLVLAGLVAIFIVQNTAVVEIRFLFWTLAMSRALVVFFVLAIGIVIGWLLRSHLAHRAERPQQP